jgi:hypothetical protein
MEKLCRCIKHILKTAQGEFAPLLSPLLEQLTSIYETHPHSDILYLARYCVSVFCKVEQAKDLLCHAFVLLSKRALHLLADHEAMIGAPDTVEDYFELVCHVMAQLPDRAYVEPLLEFLRQAFACAVRGVKLQHREASGAVCKFVCQLLSEGFADPHRPPRPPGCLALLQEQMQLHGATLVTFLMQSIAGDVPKQRMKNVYMMLEVLLRLYPDPIQQMIKAALQGLPETRAPTKAEFFEALCSAENGNDVRKALIQFAHASAYRRGGG